MQKIIECFKQNNHLEKLTMHYRQIPGGNCSSCPKCCYDNVPLSAVEFAYIIYTLGSRINDYHKKVEQWYLNQYKFVQPCIFLEDGLCQIYNSRPLTCRLFGHQSTAEQLKRIKTVRAEKIKAAEWLYHEYGIKVSKEVIDHAIAPCDFKSDLPFTKAQANQLFDTITMLSSAYYRQGLIDDSFINLTLIEWMLAYYHDESVLFEMLLK